MVFILTIKIAENNKIRKVLLYGVVAARLRSLRSDDPSSKGHPRSIKQELETRKHFKLIHELLDSYFIHLNTQHIM